ncbi:hypothetical protein BD626DRAFT_517903 [Schizophyllum amplum]|uniref:Uncharacterized protein n=1 Tax=Schizophyllum amplum TaxID=97359 RepID=A0A550BW39_9AGAR|nr:hypothetical protein BD626DRAFT_517903 [Auriculariopsis ampla]
MPHVCRPRPVRLSALSGRLRAAAGGLAITSWWACCLPARSLTATRSPLPIAWSPLALPVAAAYGLLFVRRAPSFGARLRLHAFRTFVFTLRTFPVSRFARSVSLHASHVLLRLRTFASLRMPLFTHVCPCLLFACPASLHASHVPLHPTYVLCRLTILVCATTAHDSCTCHIGSRFTIIYVASEMSLLFP